MLSPAIEKVSGAGVAAPAAATRDGTAPNGTLARTELLRRLEHHADHPSGFLAMNAGTLHYSVEGVDGFIAYRDDGHCLHQLCGMLAPACDAAVLLDAFLRFAHSRKRRVCCVQLRAGQVALYERYGFVVNQMGRSYSLDVQRFRTAGTPFMKVRNKIKRARRAGVEVRELGRDAPFGNAERSALESITGRWLEGKGEPRLLEFMVGEIDPVACEQRRIFAAYQESRMIGFISYTRSYGRFAGWMHDLSRRERVVPPGVMELVNSVAIERFRSEGIAWLNFGFTPFCGIDDEHDRAVTRSRPLSWLLRALERHGQRLYPALDQVAYKRKWQPMVETPEYVAFHGGFRWAHLLGILQITRSVRGRRR